MRSVAPVLLGAVIIGFAGSFAWLLAGGTIPQPITATVNPPANGVAVHVLSSPPGVQTRIDDVSYGRTPLDALLPPGSHQLLLEDNGLIANRRSLHVPDTGTSINISLWKRAPDAVPVRPAFPGARLLDARFVDDGRIALVYSTSQSGTPSAQLWIFDPATGAISRPPVSDTQRPLSAIALAPDGRQLAYAVPAETPVAPGLWSTAASTPSAASAGRAPEPESVWIAGLDQAEPPRRVFALPAPTSATAASPEHVTELLWMPNSTALLVISRQSGPPVRSRLSLVSVDAEAPAADLLLLPAEVVQGSATPDPTGEWLAFASRITRPGSATGLLNLCLLQVQPDGVFRDLADLGGSAQPVPPVSLAWPPAADPAAPGPLAFLAPAPVTPSASGNPFALGSLLGALRPTAQPTAIYLANVQPGGIETSPTRRLGSVTDILGPVWTSADGLYGFAREKDGTLGLRVVDAGSGAVRDTAARLPAGVGQGSALQVRWDGARGMALLMTRSSATGATSTGSSASGGFDSAWLVSFAPATSDQRAPS